MLNARLRADVFAFYRCNYLKFLFCIFYFVLSDFQTQAHSDYAFRFKIIDTVMFNVWWNLKTPCWFKRRGLRLAT